MIEAVLEYNSEGCMLYALNYPGAFARAKTKEEACRKLLDDITSYCMWAHVDTPDDNKMIITYEKQSNLAIHEADTDIVLPNEYKSLTLQEYEKGKELALKSAYSFDELYQSIPKKLFSDLGKRKTFYGFVPRTSKEMYEHTNGVTNYYMGEIQVIFENESSIYHNRVKAFELLEKESNFLSNKTYIGNGNEEWNLAKVMRRFIWHDRIHAKAMYRLGIRNWNEDIVENPFNF